MAERPIIFNVPMVRAILDGRKTMTRRVLKPQPDTSKISPPFHPEARGERAWVFMARDDFPGHSYATADFSVPYAPGDRLWVRETWGLGLSGHGDCPRYRSTMDYKCGDKIKSPHEGPFKWRPSIFMPRWASRITLEVTEVKVERLQDISEDDAKAEGAPAWTGAQQSYRTGFYQIWRSIYGEGAWADNPWVVVISFERAETKKSPAGQGEAL